METVKRGRALQLADNDINLPACSPLGDFEPVQCDPLSGNCFCVDESGFELAGTRARSLELVNCTSKSLVVLMLFGIRIDPNLITKQTRNPALDCSAGCSARTSSSWTRKAARCVSVGTLAEASDARDPRRANWKRSPAPRSLARPSQPVRIFSSIEVTGRIDPIVFMMMNRQTGQEH